MRCLLNWCEDAGLIERSPFPRRVMPRLQERAPDRLTDEEAAQVAALEAPYGFVCRLALGTGLRWGELCRAQAADAKRFRAPGVCRRAGVLGGVANEVEACATRSALAGVAEGSPDASGAVGSLRDWLAGFVREPGAQADGDSRTSTCIECVTRRRASG